MLTLGADLVEPWLGGTAPAKLRELADIAGDAVTTHLYRPGLDVHLRTALELGSTKEEIMAVYEMTTACDPRAVAASVMALAEEGVA